MNAYTTDDAIACLRKAGVPVTQQRIEIARVLFSAPVHMSADQIWATVKATAPDVSRATVYNTLRLFTEKHLVRELFVDPQRIVYDSTTTPHFHLYNMDTGEVRDLAADEIEVIGAPRLPAGVELEEVDVIVRVRNRSV
ncbi:Fur family ferric uptake regulator [Thauera sp. 27]|uniref:Fur family transcriptional regulator n=1 Tax=Thauera sp. 27 TaxID=305700 RepID=UPI0002D0B9A9|nr:Fur family transcriptional regulator [Thauera sp. 27]ENO78512.1 Fur family ferric uptake regulator [Thauera sp. 27]